jgi:modification methylase
MKTQHKIHYKNCNAMEEIESASVDLMVTSPPYPMIAMWDDIFTKQRAPIGKALNAGDGPRAFELMHEELDKTWREVYRVLKCGGFACINIGDATRTIKDNFALYPNHMRIQKCMLEAGFTALPCILWRKQTNAPNKFMGSGMLPAGAYVTLEHEYILIFRKGSKRVFSKESAKENRRASALFWEERNIWFSDVWMDIKGARQDLSAREDRSRSAAYPFEFAYRLINMYSTKEDLVLDPFLGTGTSMIAAMASGRNSVGYELDRSMKNGITEVAHKVVDFANTHTLRRVENHLSFVKTRLEAGKPIKYVSGHHQFPVITRQEKELLLNEVLAVQDRGRSAFEITYSDTPLKNTVLNSPIDGEMGTPQGSERSVPSGRKGTSKKRPTTKQRPLFG